jgi:hypothetical protein
MGNIARMDFTLRTGIAGERRNVSGGVIRHNRVV